MARGGEGDAGERLAMPALARVLVTRARVMRADWGVRAPDEMNPPRERSRPENVTGRTASDGAPNPVRRIHWAANHWAANHWAANHWAANHWAANHCARITVALVAQ